MAGGDEAIAALRAALSVSPDNVPLRKHLADTLAGLARWTDAETEYKAALALAPADDDLKVGLASTFYEQGKYSAAIVILESRLSGTRIPARMLLLHARLLLRSGDTERAVEQFRAARETDASVNDPELSELLGMEQTGPSWKVVEGKVREAEAEEDTRSQGYELERPKITFAHVGGMEDLKEEIRMKIIHPLSHPELYAAYGKKMGGGILMYGPPGCGKTYLARATAGEVKAKFVAIGINDVLDMWLGNSERNLHALFDQARRNKPCVLFFDEVDALGASRSDAKHAGSRVINQFLSEMDGVTASNDGVLILAATNAPWHLDSAFRRPGRFDRILFVPPPDAPARAQVLRLMLTGKPCQEIDIDDVARKTDGFSGADLKAVVDVAVEHKLREAFKSGTPQPITTKDLLTATKGLKPTTREWFATARNYALYSNQGGIYDDILKHLKI